VWNIPLSLSLSQRGAQRGRRCVSRLPPLSAFCLLPGPSFSPVPAGHGSTDFPSKIWESAMEHRRTVGSCEQRPPTFPFFSVLSPSTTPLFFAPIVSNLAGPNQQARDRFRSYCWRSSPIFQSHSKQYEIFLPWKQELQRRSKAQPHPTTRRQHFP
jgi:hypothetical protein